MGRGVLALASSLLGIAPPGGVNGRAQILDLSSLQHPVISDETDAVGGRAATMASFGNRHYLICNGAAASISNGKVSESWELEERGPLADGLPYGGGLSGRYAVLTLHSFAIVVRLDRQ